MQSLKNAKVNVFVDDRQDRANVAGTVKLRPGAFLLLGSRLTGQPLGFSERAARGMTACARSEGTSIIAKITRVVMHWHPAHWYPVSYLTCSC